MSQLKTEVGQSGLLGLPVRIVANPQSETSHLKPAKELVLIPHQLSEAKTAKAMKMTWSYVTRISLAVSYSIVTIQKTNLN